MHEEKGFENLVLKNAPPAALIRFANTLVWPPHLKSKYANQPVHGALSEYFAWSKGNWGIADFLAQCSEAEIPQWIRTAVVDLKQICDPPAPAPNPGTNSIPPAAGPVSGG